MEGYIGKGVVLSLTLLRLVLSGPSFLLVGGLGL